MPDEPDYTLAVEEGRRALATQDAQVGAARTRAVALLGAGGGASVIAGVAVSTGGVPSRIAGAVALVGFIVVAVCAYLVLRHPELTWTIDSETLVTWADKAEM